MYTYIYMCACVFVYISILIRNYAYTQAAWCAWARLESTSAPACREASPTCTTPTEASLRAATPRWSHWTR